MLRNTVSGAVTYAKRARIAFLLTSLGSLLACATVVVEPVLDPALTVATRYAAAVERGDGTAAHALLTPAVRAAIDADALTRALSVVPAGQRTLPLDGPPDVTLRFPGTTPLTFAMEGASFRLVQGVPAFDRRDSPSIALTTLARAVRVKDAAVLHALVPVGRRGQITEAVLRDRLNDPAFLSETNAALRALEGAGPGEPVGTDRWSIRAPGHEATFVREAGGWALQDLL